MGLTTWENAPDGKIVKPDVSIAKNYLNALELEDMGRFVNAVLDMAERMAKRHIPMTMEDWANRIDIILEAGGDTVLDNAGQISAEFAKQFAESEFEKYRIIQDRLFESDFDRFNQNLLEFPDDIQKLILYENRIWATDHARPPKLMIVDAALMAVFVEINHR